MQYASVGPHGARAHPSALTPPSATGLESSASAKVSVAGFGASSIGVPPALVDAVQKRPLADSTVHNTAPGALSVRRAAAEYSRLLVIGTVAGMKHLTTALLLTGTFLLTGCSASPDTTTPSTSTPTEGFVVRGTMTVSGSTVMEDGAYEGHTCFAATGYDDITSGTQLLLSDDAGTTLAVTTFSPGRFTASVRGRGHYDGPCAFAFEFTSVPRIDGYYTLTAGKRGSMKYTRAQLASPIQLTLN